MVVGALSVLGATAVGIARSAWNRTTARAVEQLRESARVDRDAVAPAFSQALVEGLPEPVKHYLTFALDEGQPRFRTARIRWSGEFQSSPDGGWAPFTADQYVTSDPPGFVWDARIRMLPLTQVQVRDGYFAGTGTMLGRVAAVVPVVDQGGTAEMAQSALTRWLGEAVWFPTALLPGGAVRWEAVDDSTARATVTDGEVDATAEFHFARTGEIKRMTAMRYRDVDGTAVRTPFEGRYGAYERRSGIMVPSEAEVAWRLPQGRFPYWRGSPRAVEYEVLPTSAPADVPISGAELHLELAHRHLDLRNALEEAQLLASRNRLHGYTSR